MIKLKNIAKNDNFVHCNIIPEDSASEGTLLFDINEDKVKEYKLPTGYEWCRNHIAHAESAIRKMIAADSLTKEQTIAWG